MNLNPITALINQLEKLINEHASAAVLRDHLALFKDQLLILEKENVRLAKENSALMTANEKLISENKNFRIANDELAAKIKEYENPSHKSSLNETQVKILTLLGKYSTNDEIVVDNIAAQCNLSPQATQFYLEELEDAQLIQASYSVGRAPIWYIIQEGRRYLMKHGLL